MEQRTLSALAVWLAASCGGIWPSGASAQQRTDAPRSVLGASEALRQGVSLTNADVVERLRASGWTRGQMRAGLQRLGRDPGLADRYFDALDGRAPVPEGEPPHDLVQTLGALGVPAAARGNEAAIVSPWAAGGAAAAPEPDTSAGPRLFGLDLFRRFTTQFDAPLEGPVDPDYRLGTGDEITLILTGEIEANWALEVTREGFIVIPDAGQVFVTGLRLSELADRLYAVLGRTFSGVTRSAEAPIRFHVGLGRLRTSVVYVIGETVRPGAYSVSSVATALNALYLAGGPADGASFRTVEVRRRDSVRARLDLYEYLLRGETRGDLRLEHGDVVFLPVTGPRVTVTGAVRRPAIYELRPSDRLSDVLAFAGGLRSSASSHRIQIDRVLPPEARAPGVDRVLIDVGPGTPAAGVPLLDGDLVRVFEVATERRNRVVLLGEVNRPGVYEWRAGLTLGQLIARAEGFAEDAYTARSHIYRLDPRSHARYLIGVDAAATTPLEDRDSVVVFSRSDLSNPRSVTIAGHVKNPGAFLLAEGMTLQDLILAAGGFTHGAHVAEAELARMASLSDAAGRATVSRIRLGGRPDPARPDVFDWAPDASEVRLMHGDHVFIRKAPDFEALETVHIGGEVRFPGLYVIAERSERLSSVLARAGGPTPEAHLAGAQLLRRGELVGTDFARAAGTPGGAHDLEVLAGDSIRVPRLDPTVLVRGAVGFEARVRYEAGRNVDYYIEQAGGYAEGADRARTSVTQQNGERKLVRIRPLLPDGKPRPGPGSTVFVPARPPTAKAGIDWDALLTRVVGMASATATVLIAADRIRNQP
jgi:protein involved in polysaccharide export with SLBB domain